MQTTRTKVLVVDDDLDARQFMQDLLTDHGYDVVTEALPNQVLRTVRKESPDIITMDLKMPEVTGDQIVRALQHAKIQTPIVVISGQLEKRILMRLLNMGIKHILKKPVDLERLTQVLEEALKDNTSPAAEE